MDLTTWPTRLFVVDVEGNGHTPPDLIELAAVPIAGGRPGEARHWMVRPPHPIAPRVSRIHGIVDKDVAACPAWGEVAGDVLALLDGAWIVAHSATVEYGVLARHLPTWRPAGALDTLRLARATVPDAGRFGLDPLIEHCAVDTSDLPGQRHRAGFDAAATALLLLHLSQSHASWDDMARVGVPAGLPGCPDSDVVEGTLW